jgi:hypothetical protein
VPDDTIEEKEKAKKIKLTYLMEFLNELFRMPQGS